MKTKIQHVVFSMFLAFLIVHVVDQISELSQSFTLEIDKSEGSQMVESDFELIDEGDGCSIFNFAISNFIKQKPIFFYQITDLKFTLQIDNPPPR